MQYQETHYPELRFPEFSESWLSKELKEIAGIYDGTHQTPKYTKSGVPFVSVENIEDLKATSKFISEATFKKDFKTFPQKGDVLMTRITAGVIGATNVVKDNNPLAYYVSLALIRPIEKIDSNFLSFNISSLRFRRELNKRIIHVAFPKKINLGDIGHCSIIFPDLKEQAKIAAFLGAVDEKLAQLQKKKDLLEDYKKGCMQKLFSQEIRFTDDNGNPFPDWEEQLFGKVYDFKSTNSFSRDQLNYEGGEVYNIHYGDIHTKFRSKFELQREDAPFVNSDVNLEKILEDKYCQQGDVIFADASEDYNDIGKAIEVVNLDGKKMLAGLHTLLARQLNNDIHVGFAGYLMANAKIRKQIKVIAQGTKVLGISAKEMKKITLKFPTDKNEQKKIADFLSAIDDKIALVAEELDKAKIFKRGLLQQMFV